MSGRSTVDWTLSLLIALASSAGTGCNSGASGVPVTQNTGNPPVDSTAPTVQSTVPGSDAAGVLQGITEISATFDDLLDCTTVTGSSFTVVRASDGAPVPGAVACSGATATFTLSFQLHALTAFHVRISTAVKDDAGNPLATDYQWNFTTGGVETTPPTLATFSPNAGATQIALQPTIRATFSEAIDCATVRTDPNTSPTFYVNHDPAVPVAAALTCSGATASITPFAPLAPNTTYAVGLSRAIQDLAGNAFAGFGWSFTTGDGTPHGTLSFTPLPGLTAPAAPLLTIVPNLPVTIQRAIPCALPSLGGFGTCTTVSWFESQPGPTGVDKIVSLWFEPTTGEVSLLQYEAQPLDDYSWGWLVRASTLDPLPGVTIDRVAGIVTIRDTLMGISTRPAPVTNPAPVIANGTLTYP